MPIITEVDIPKTSTGPATVNIFPPTPIIYPSDLYSMAGETIEFANPVIGINEPIIIIETIVAVVVSSKPLYLQ